MWRALTQAEEFGSWFGVKLEGELAPQRRVTGRITTPGYEHLSFELQVQQLDPQSYFSYRWHPYAIDLQPVGRSSVALEGFRREVIQTKHARTRWTVACL